eukprot:gene18122-21071_t
MSFSHRNNAHANVNSCRLKVPRGRTQCGCYSGIPDSQHKIAQTRLFRLGCSKFQVERPSNFDVGEIDNDRGQQPWKRAKMQSYRSRNRTSSLVEDLLVSALSHDGMETVEVRDLNVHEEAALIVTFANHGQDIQEERLNWKIRACYRLRRKYQFLYRTAAWSILFVHVFSRPLWTLRIGGTEDWNEASVYPSYELPYMPVLASSLLIGLATLILWLSTLLEFGYHGRSRHQYFSVFFAVVLTLISITILMQLSYCVAGKIPDFSASPLFSL